MIQRHYLNGVEINEPSNYEALSIDLNFEKGAVNQNGEAKEAVSINQWEIGTGDNRQGKDGLSILKNYLAKGITGGPGVTEGIPFTIKLDNEAGTVYTLFDGYLDLWSSKIEPDRILADATEQGKLDWLNQVADSVSFQYLYEVENIIQDHHFVAIPYVINRKVNGVELLSAAVSLYVIIKMIVDVINEIIALINDYDIVYISAIIRIILLLVQLAALLIAAYQLLTDLYILVIQPIKVHYGMKVQDCIRLGLQHFGLKLSSSILEVSDYRDMVYLPEKTNIKEYSSGIFDGLSGLVNGDTNDTKGYPKMTFGQFLRMFEQKFNAKIIISGDTLYFEAQDFNITKPALVLPPVEDNGFQYNKEDFYSNIVLSYATDLNDKNTIQEYQGTSVQVITKPKTVVNQKMVLTRQLQEINFGMAMGKRKTELSTVEKRVQAFQKEWTKHTKAFLDILSPILQSYEWVMKQSKAFTKTLKTLGIKTPFKLTVFVAGPSSAYGLQFVMDLTYKVLKAVEGGALNINGLSTEATSRINLLKMENDFVNVPKILLLSIGADPRQNHLHTLHETILNAKHIYQTYHKYKSFVPDANGVHNQYKIYQLEPIPFTFADFEKVRTSNRIFNSDMKEGKLLNLKFIPADGTATGEYKINELYTNNLETEIIEPDGK